MTKPTFDQAAAAYEAFVLETNEGGERVWLATEAQSDTVLMELAAARLKLAIETYLSDLARCEYVGKVHSTPEELCVLIIDYDQDSVGHRASDILRAAVK